MTRINVIPVECLTDKHLLAEYKEITRPFNKAYKRLMNNKLDFDRFDSYRLNAGHETFFFDKLHWLYFRYHLLRDELLRRSFNINLAKFDKIACKLFNNLSNSCLWNWYTPTPDDIYLNMARLAKRSNLEKVKKELDSN